MVEVNDKTPRIRRAKALRLLLNGRFFILTVLGLCYIWSGTEIYSSLSREGTNGVSMPKDAPIDYRTKGVLQYSTENIAKTIQSLALAPNRLLIYNPATDSFLTYTVAPQEADNMMKYGGRCNRCRLILPMLVNALLECCGERFNRRQPLFQMLLSDADFTYSNCTLGGHSCDTSNFAPMVHWGSILKDSRSVLPFVHAFPNPNFLACMREWYLNKSTSDCTVWVPPYRHNASWSDLIPQVIWRGSPFNFLETLGVEYFSAKNETSVPEPHFRPRAIAVQMSRRSKKQDSTAWLDVVNAKKMVMTPFEMAAYRYQIDIGGAGGTSWTGTLEKLAMPGLLLHHETPAMDWFYNEMVPWKHYVPIRTDLTDLKDKYDWAERNMQESEEIAHNGTLFARSFFSSQNMAEQYTRFFGRTNLINIVDAYDHGADESLHSILDAYKSMKIASKKVASCTKQRCFIETLHGALGFALNSSECFKVSNISAPTRMGPIETCYN